MERENNYDLLRVICAIAVISLHVSEKWISACFNLDIFGGGIAKANIMTALVYDTVSKFSVPCFIMLSGAFILMDERNEDYSVFYSKSFKKIGIHIIIFSVLYFFYDLCKKIVIIEFQGGGRCILDPFINVLKGMPFYHMWYLYMMIWVYLLVPVVLKWKKSINEKTFNKMVIIFMVVGCLSNWSSSHVLRWDLGQSFCYLGYFMIGYVIRRCSIKHRNGIKALGFIALGSIVNLFVAYLHYGLIMDGIDERTLRYGLTVPCNPLVVLASILIFVGFSMLPVGQSFEKISSYTYFIYLFHGGVWSLGFQVVKKMCGPEGDNRIWIPLSIGAVFLISFGLSILYKRIWERKATVDWRSNYFKDYSSYNK